MLLPRDPEDILGSAGIDFDDRVSAPGQYLLQSDAARGEQAHGPEGDGEEPDAPLQKFTVAGPEVFGVSFFE